MVRLYLDPQGEKIFTQSNAPVTSTLQTIASTTDKKEVHFVTETKEQ